MVSIVNTAQHWQNLYHGFSYQSVGIGLASPNIYATPAYAKKKQQHLVLGGIADISYAGFEHDREPLILSIKYEPQYNTILAYNLHYIPEMYRKAMLKLIFTMNKPRLQQNLPMYIDYDIIKQKIPVSENIVRRYKIIGIRNVDNVMLMNWPRVIAGNNKWQYWYKGVIRKTAP